MPLREFSREQAWLLPPTLDDMLPEDHGARFVAVFVDSIDRSGWEELGVSPQGEERGAAAYHPGMLLGVWLYGFMTGVRSTRKLETACREQLPYMWLSGNQRPDHNTLWRFYCEHREKMRGLFRRTVKTAVEAGLVNLVLQAVDGTRISGNASKDRTLDAKGLRRLLKGVEESIRRLEAGNAQSDEPAAPSLPQELADAQELRRKVQEALKLVEAGEGASRANLTDPDAGLLRTRNGFITGYNAQAVAAPLGEPETPEGASGMLITAVGISSSTDDHPWLLPMIEESAGNTKGLETVTLADAGYHSGANLLACESGGHQVLMPGADSGQRLAPYHKEQFIHQAETDTYQCPLGARLEFVESLKHRTGYGVRRYRAPRAVCRSCPAFGECTKDRQGRSIKVSEHELRLRRHRELMATGAAKARYRLRKQLVEPVFGILKECHGARRFLLRGLAGVRAEWTLLATAFNLASLYRLQKRGRRPKAQRSKGYATRVSPAPSNRCRAARRRASFTTRFSARHPTPSPNHPRCIRFVGQALRWGGEPSPYDGEGTINPEPSPYDGEGTIK